jgi:hypothetical protein
MAAPATRIEELFLRIFKVTLLIVMGLALIGIVILVAAAVYEFSQTPKEPPPAQKAPERTINLEDLKTFLIEEEKKKNQKGDTARPQTETSQPSLRFQEEATVLFRCSDSFAQSVRAQIDDNNDAKKQQLLGELRARVEEDARSPLRGEPWVKAVVDFTCKVLADPSIVALRKDAKVVAVFYPTIRFHGAAWDNIQLEKQRFEEAERNRVSSARAAEQLRIGLAKARGLSYLIGAGSAFALFMVLALYLLASKIESNLRGINEAIRTAAPQVRA